MCGRFSLTNTWEEMFEYFSLVRPVEPGPPMPPRYNIAPAQPIVIIRRGEDNRRQGLLVRWGLVPSWVKDPDDFTLLINARSETATEKPSFKSAMNHRRILIPVSGFYEWQRFGGHKKSQPFWVTSPKDKIIAFAGLMETWLGADGSEIDTACILTTAANDNFASIHKRLPMVIQQNDFDRWLDCKQFQSRHIHDMIHPAPNDYFTPVAVSDDVNKVTNNTVSIQKPINVTRETQIDLDAPQDIDQPKLI